MNRLKTDCHEPAKCGAWIRTCGPHVYAEQGWCVAGCPHTPSPWRWPSVLPFLPDQCCPLELWWCKRPVAALSSPTAINHVGYWATETGLMPPRNWIFYCIKFLIHLNLSSHMRLVAPGLCYVDGPFRTDPDEPSLFPLGRHESPALTIPQPGCSWIRSHRWYTAARTACESLHSGSHPSFCSWSSASIST